MAKTGEIVTTQLTQDQLNQTLARLLPRVPNANEPTILYYLDCEAKIAHYKRLQQLIEGGEMEAHMYAGSDTILYRTGSSWPLYSPL